MIKPILGKTIGGKRKASHKSLADALFTRSQQRVLGVMFGQPERSFYTSELIRLAKGGSGAAQRELARLERSGLVTAKHIGHQKHYQANPDSALFDELHSIMLKTVGLAEPVRDALSGLAPHIQAAFVYGSVAKGRDRAQSDIDLMIITDQLTYGDVFAALETANRRLGRSINPTVYTPGEFSKRVKDQTAFLTRVLEQPKIWIIGTPDDLPS